MNLTKEQILEEELSEDILEIIEQKDKPEELRYFKRYILDAMERYAQQQVKNLNIPAVIKSVCDDCTAYPFDERGKTPLCKTCKKNPSQTIL